MSKIARTYWTEERIGGKKKIRQVPETDAFLIGSLTSSGMHAPLFDLDFPVTQWGTRVTFGLTVHVDTWFSLVHTCARAGLITAASVGDPTGQLENPYLVFKVPCTVRGSSTSGHFHLEVNSEISWSQYQEILIGMCDAGLIETKYLNLCMRHRMGMLIKPSLTKKEIGWRKPTNVSSYFDDDDGGY